MSTPKTAPQDEQPTGGGSVASLLARLNDLYLQLVSIKAKCPEIIRLESPLIAARNVLSLNAGSGSGGETDRADQGDFCHDQGLA
jgi:hypothetical protein